MKRGPPPKPTRLRVIEGKLGHRPLNQGEPEPEIGIPPPPIVLQGTALEEWGALAAELYRLKLLTKIDRAALAAYCQAYAIWYGCVEQFNVMALRDELSRGLMIKTKNGHIVPNPILGQMNKAARDMVRYAAELGMTPSARSRISTFEALANEPLSRLLSLPPKRA